MPVAAHVEGNVSVVVSGALVPDTAAPEFATLRDSVALSVLHAFAGTGGAAGSATQMYRVRQTINAASNFDLDLASSVTNAFGDALAFTAVKVLVIHNRSSTIAITVNTTAPAAPWQAALNGVVTLRPGGVLALVCSEATGWAVAAGSADTIRIANGGGASVDVDVCVLGKV